MIKALRIDKSIIFISALTFPLIGSKILSVLLVLAAFFWFVELIRSKRHLTLGKIDIAIILFFAFNVVTSVFSSAPIESFKQLIVLAGFICAYFVISNDFTRKDIRLLLFALLASAVIPVLQGIRQEFFLTENQDLWIYSRINP